MMNEPGAWDSVVAVLAAGGAWLAGESGRIVVASGFGGLVRWFSEEKRTIRNGIVSWIAGAATGYYTWPALMKAPGFLGFADIPRDPENIAMAGFLMGALGISAVKIFVAIVEKRAEKLHGEE